jgi:hypothetical protein
MNEPRALVAGNGATVRGVDSEINAPKRVLGERLLQ